MVRLCGGGGGFEAGAAWAVPGGGFAAGFVEREGRAFGSKRCRVVSLLAVWGRCGGRGFCGFFGAEGDLEGGGEAGFGEGRADESVGTAAMPGAVFQRRGGDWEPEFCGRGVCREEGAFWGETEGRCAEDRRDNCRFVLTACAEGASGGVGGDPGGQVCKARLLDFLKYVEA